MCFFCRRAPLIRLGSTQKFLNYLRKAQTTLCRPQPHSHPRILDKFAMWRKENEKKIEMALILILVTVYVWSSALCVYKTARRRRAAHTGEEFFHSFWIFRRNRMKYSSGYTTGKWVQIRPDDKKMANTIRFAVHPVRVYVNFLLYAWFVGHFER